MGRCRQGLLRRPRSQVRQRRARRGREERPLTGERAFIEALRGLASDPAARNLDDDAAVLEFGNEALVLTHDMMVEGVHWLPGQDMADVAWKLVAVNLSDLAAKGARPVGVLFGYLFGDQSERLVDGLREALTAFDVPLLGGDTVSGGPPQSLGLTAIGQATHRPVPSRSGAKPGDALWSTGPVGAAMIGFEALRDNTPGDSEAYRRPRPLLAEGRALAPHVTAMMDVSDGILLDASRLAEASGVTIAIATTAVPLAAPECRRADALRWGDDYQLLFTCPSAVTPPVPAHRIGEVRAPQGTPLLLNGDPPAAGDRLGYQHAS